MQPLHRFPEIDFEDRIKGLFRDYPKLASQKYLEPFPGWYRKRYQTGGKNDTRYIDHLWQYALAQVLKEEFFGDAFEPVAALTSADSPELAENQLGI